MKATKRTADFRGLELKLDASSIAPHTVYFKEHAVREHTADKPPGRTLLLVNVPPYADESGLKNAFKEAGNVTAVHFSLKPSTAEVKIIKKFIEETPKCTFKAAYLVFDKVAELDKALKLKKLQPLNSEEYQTKVGVKKWIDEYNNQITSTKAMKEEVERFMQEHDSKVVNDEKKEKELEEADDDGWVTVTKRGKVGNFARTEKIEKKIIAKEDKKNKRKELKNFYTFQIRESKMKHIVSLRQKFEEDKKKIAQIKQSRRFKPF